MTGRKEPSCTNCGAPARYVAGDDSGLQWFECGEHTADDNLAGSPRTTLEPLEEWRSRLSECPQSAIRAEQLKIAAHLRQLGDHELAALVELMTPEVDP